jgi:tetratricopeptide (TPR) repeat protein
VFDALVRIAALLLAASLITYACVPSTQTLAVRDMDSGNPAPAIAAYERLLKRSHDPISAARLHGELARAEQMRGRYDRALAHQEEAVRLYPTSVKALADLGALYDLGCNPRKACAALERAEKEYARWLLAGRPVTPDLGWEIPTPALWRPSPASLKDERVAWFRTKRRLLCFYERWFQRLPEALAIHRTVVAENPLDFETWSYLADLETYAGHPTAALHGLETMSRLKPADRGVHRRLAEQYARLGRKEAVVDQVLRSGMRREEARYRILTTYTECGTPAEGLSVYHRRFPEDRDEAGILLTYAGALEAAGQRNQARAVLEKAPVALAGDLRIQERLAEFQFLAKDHLQAARTYLRLAAKRPDQFLSSALSELNAAHRLELALPLLEDFLRTHPREPTVRYHYAAALGELGKHDRAAQIYRQLLADVRTQPIKSPSEASKRKLAAATGPVRRRVLAFYKRTEHEAPGRNRIHDCLEVVLNHLGLVVDYRAAEDPPPTSEDLAPYRGIVTWFHTEVMPNADRFAQWLARQPFEGRPVVVLERFGCLTDPASSRPTDSTHLASLQKALGLRFGGKMTENPRLIRVVNKVSDMVEFERPLNYETDYFTELASIDPKNRVYLKLERVDRPGATCDAVFTGPGGAFCLATYAFYEDQQWFRRQWRINPFRLFRETFHLEGFPAMDFTTRCGVRLAYSHVDGDGSEELCRWDLPKTCSEVFRDHILARRRIPMTASLIAGYFDRRHGNEGVSLTVAQDILRNPWIEPAHHSYSHPFDWKERRPGLDLPGYTFDPRQEVLEAKRILEETVCSPGQRINVMQWSGRCNPDADVLAECARNGLLNINGGDPRMDGNYPSVAHLAPLHRIVGGHLQNLTSGSNETAMTDMGDLPNIVYRNVTQTFERTESPRRLSPVNAYFHFTILADPGGARALDDVLDWIEQHQLHHIRLSEFIRITAGFRTAAITTVGERRFRVTGFGACRTLRFDDEPGTVDMTASQHVVGFRKEGKSLYVALDGADALIQLTSNAPATPYVRLSTADIEHFAVHPHELRFEMAGIGPQEIVISGLPPRSAVALYDAAVPGAGPPDRWHMTILPVDSNGSLSFKSDLHGKRRVIIRRAGRRAT